MLEKSNEKESCVFDIEKKIHASLKKILLSNIVFKEGHLQDPGDMLHMKYKPLNANYKPGQNNNQESNTNKAIDIPKPQVVLYPEENIQNKWQQVRRIGPGLANLGNTCFLNSVLQVLTYTPPFMNYILSGYHKSNCKAVGFCMQCELTNHINRVLNHNPNMGAVRPMSIIQKLQCIGKNFRFGRQEDAHEFLRFVVEAVQKSDYAGKPKLDKVSKETTVANAIFGGYYRSQVQCKQCHLESNTYDPIMDLNLDIKDCSSILHAFQKTIRPDFLTGDNKYFCERCKMKTDAVKKGTIHKEPNVLTLQLKRFDFSKMFGGKISKEIHFPEDLNIRPFMSVKSGDAVNYHLYGVLVHSGYSCNSGHYYCYVKAPNGTWYEMNDNRVTQASMKTVLGAQAYLLFYVKKTSKKSQNVSKQGTLNARETMTTKDPLKHKNNDHHGLKKTAVVYGPQKPPHLKDVPLILNKLAPSNMVTQPMNSTSSIGVPVKRKSEPKINIKIGKKNLLQPSIFSFRDKKNSDSATPQEEGVSDTAASTTTQHKQSPKKPSLITTSTPCKPSEEEKHREQPKVNSLQKLSESYADDSPSSSVPSSPITTMEMERQPSPLPLSLPSPLVTTNSENEKDSKTPAKEKSSIINLYLSLTPSTDHHSGKESKSTNGNGKLKMKSTKYRNRNSIWSPVTKGALHPRVIINKYITNDIEPLQPPKDHTSPDRKAENVQSGECVTTATVTSSWKEEKRGAQERMFGPMMPPPPTVKRQRNDSTTSEAGSLSSVHSQSGNWNIHEKTDNNKDVPQGLQEKQDNEYFHRERQHVGWNVFQSSYTTEQDDSLARQSRKKSKKEKKHKKKKKHRHHDTNSSANDEPGVHNGSASNNSDDYIEVSVDGHNRKRKHADERLDHPVSAHTLESPKKKKKKDKYERYERERSASGTDETNREKKKKRDKNYKHKPKHRNEADDDFRLQKKDTLLIKKHDSLNASKNREHFSYSSTVTSIDTSRCSEPITANKSFHGFDASHRNSEEPPSLGKSYEQNTLKLTSTDETLLSSTSSKKMKRKHKHKKERKYSSSDNESSNQRHLIPTPSKINDDSPVRYKSKDERCFSADLKRDEKHVDGQEKVFNKKKDVPVYVWDDQKKKINTWNGAVKSKTVEQLLNGGPKVTSWEGSDNTEQYNLKYKDEGERGQDDWDEEYDAGKTKKVKNKSKESDEQHRYHASFNSFQTLQTHRNETKDKTTTFRSNDHHGYHNNNKYRHINHRKDRVSNGGSSNGGNGGRFR